MNVIESDEEFTVARTPYPIEVKRIGVIAKGGRPILSLVKDIPASPITIHITEHAYCTSIGNGERVNPRKP